MLVDDDAEKDAAERTKRKKENIYIGVPIVQSEIHPDELQQELLAEQGRIAAERLPNWA